MLAVIDAVRAEMLESGPEGWLAGARLGLKLSDERMEELAGRLEGLIGEYARGPADADGRRYGLFINLHRLT
jgi:hypothetical protein